jgi:hypothetical protein
MVHGFDLVIRTNRIGCWKIPVVLRLQETTASEINSEDCATTSKRYPLDTFDLCRTWRKSTSITSYDIKVRGFFIYSLNLFL